MKDHTANWSYMIPQCLYSSPRGTECVLPAHHIGQHSWGISSPEFLKAEQDKKIMEEPLTKINPANKEEKDFWENCFVMLLQPSSDIVVVAKRADRCLQEYRKRLAHP